MVTGGSIPPIEPGPDEELFHEPAPEHLPPPSTTPLIGNSPPSGPGGFPPRLAAEPSARRLRQFGFLAALTVLVVVFAVWLLVSWNHKQDEAKDNAAAANQLCKQIISLGQPCAAQAVSDGGGVATGQAIVPVPAASANLPAITPGANNTVAPTDENGVPQAYQPGADALVVAVGVAHDRLILTYSDGARVDAGPVDLATLAIVLRAQASASPSPFPSASPSPSPAETMPPGDDVPEPTWTVRPTEFEPPKDLESESTP